MKQITEEQIREAAVNHTDSGNWSNNNDEYGDNLASFMQGAKWMQSQQPEWVAINLDDEETLPNDFEPVLCWTADNNLQVLMMLKYSGGVDCYEWETQGLKPNKSFPIDFVSKWIFIDDPS